LKYSEIQGINLAGANLTGTSFYWSDLTGANLLNAVLKNTDFT